MLTMRAIRDDEVVKYGAIFERMKPMDGKIDGEACKPVMLQSQLSTETLGRIWDLADIDGDGYLDRPEFIVAMHLITRCADGDMLPQSLPPSLIPPGKEHYLAEFSFNSVKFPLEAANLAPTSPHSLALIAVPQLMQQQQQTKQPVSHWSIDPLSLSPSVDLTNQAHAYPPWAIGAEEMAKAGNIFASLDLDADGLISGVEVRDVLLHSGLNNATLAQIWDLVDINGSGMLNSEQFAVALRLATDLMSSAGPPRDLPRSLPASLIPPSLRSLPPDPTLFEESNKLTMEINAINRKRAEVEAFSSSLTLDSQRRTADCTHFQRQYDTLQLTARNLDNQRSEADRHLSDYAQKRDALDNALKELQTHVNTERQSVEDFKNQVNTQQASARSQEGVMDRLRGNLQDLIREETQLQARIAENSRRLESIDMENRLNQTRVEKANSWSNSLETKKGQLLQALDQYTNLLNGDSSAPELDELFVKTLLDDSDLVAPNKNGASKPFQPTSGSAWSSIPAHKGNGLDSLFASSMLKPDTAAAPAGSAFAEDPFAKLPALSDLSRKPSNTMDPFASDPFVTDTMESGLKTNPEDTSNLFALRDPFNDCDPFANDPFTIPMDKTGAFSTDATMDDPFMSSAKSVDPMGRGEVIVASGVDFDAVFGSTNQQQSDPFDADPFTSLELKAVTGEKVAPPRPKTKPSIGLTASMANSDQFNSNSRLHLSTRSSSVVQQPSMFRETSPSGGSDHSHHAPKSATLLSRVYSSNKSSSRKHDRDLSEYSGKLNQEAATHHTKRGKSADWSPSGLSESEQLNLATVESQRLAKLEAKARAREDADLELAIQLSKLETATAAFGP